MTHRGHVCLTKNIKKDLLEKDEILQHDGPLPRGVVLLLYQRHLFHTLFPRALQLSGT